MMSMSCKDGKGVMDNGKYVRYTPEQVEALERVYHECPKPSSIRRQQLIRDCPILSNIETKQIKVWFQNRRYNWALFISSGNRTFTFLSSFSYTAIMLNYLINLHIVVIICSVLIEYSSMLLQIGDLVVVNNM